MSQESSAPSDPDPSASGILALRMGPGANCSSAGSAVDVLFYGSVIVGALAVALVAAFPPRSDASSDDAGEGASSEREGGDDADGQR